MYRKTLPFAAFLVLFTACAPVGAEPPVVEPDVTELGDGGAAETKGLADIELCDAEDYRPLIGTGISAAVLPEDPRLRAYGVNDIITQEYIPQRTNIVYGTDGIIQRVYCG